MKRPFYLILGFILFAFNTVTAQNTNSDFMRSIGMIYVVIGVIVIIFIGIIVFLINLERKLTKLENQIKKNE